MKKIYILIVFALFSQFTASAQTGINKDKLAVRDWEAGLNFGLAQYYGDVSNRTFFEKISSGETRFGMGLFGRKYFNEYIGLGGHFQFLSLRSVKENYSNGTPLNNAFTSNTFQGGLHMYLNFSNLFFGLTDRPVSVYGLAGLGYIRWNSTLKNSVTDAIIWQNGMVSPGVSYKTGALNMPLTLGLDIRLTNELRLNVEGSVQTTFSDDLDFYSDGFRHDILFYGSVGLSYIFNYKGLQAKKPTQQTQIPRRKEPVKVLDYESVQPVQPERSRPQSTLPVVRIDQPRYEEPSPQGQYEFMVQVIAMSRSRIDTESFRRRFNIETPIVENTFSGLYRYSTGRFSSFSEAEAYSRVIRSKGIHDAFVVAYRGNERISITSDMKR
jgi:hypothetical protein